MDFRNTFLYHLAVASLSVLLIFVFYNLGINLIRATAGVAFILLFLTLIIGPAMRLWRPALEALPWNLPWSWRGELGIWFTIISISHILLVLNRKQWDIMGHLTSMRVSDLLGWIAIILAIILAITSFSKIIKFIGMSSWRWLHGFAYVIFYLVGAHVINNAFLRAGRPEDWLHWSYLVMIIIIIILQIIAFLKTVINYRKSLTDK